MVNIDTLDKILRYCLYFEVGGTILVLIFTAVMSSWFADIDFDHAPGKLSWNLTVAVITLVCFISMSVTRRFKNEMWEKMILRKYSWPRLTIHVVLFVFWLVASATAFWTCGDLCPASNADWVSIPGKHCTCTSSTKRAYSPKYKGGRGHHDGGGISVYHATQAFDILLMFCFLATSILIFYRWHAQNQSPVERSEMQEQPAETPVQCHDVTEGTIQHQQEVPKHNNTYEGV